MSERLYFNKQTEQLYTGDMQPGDRLATLQEIAEWTANSPNRHIIYPSIGDQLDMMYWDKVNGTNNWQETITSLKVKHPKN